eukprot:COSAG03_NODE_11120_length_610_cov_1.600783_1_plen_59_part_10
MRSTRTPPLGQVLSAEGVAAEPFRRAPRACTRLGWAAMLLSACSSLGRRVLSTSMSSRG